jgi:hypothetical protein
VGNVVKQAGLEDLVFAAPLIVADFTIAFRLEAVAESDAILTSVPVGITLNLF